MVDIAKPIHRLALLALLLCGVIVFSCAGLIRYYSSHREHEASEKIVVEDDGLRLCIWNAHFIGDHLYVAFRFEITRRDHPWVLESPWYLVFTFVDGNDNPIDPIQKEVVFPSEAFVTGRALRWDSELIITPPEGSRAFTMQLGRSRLKTKAVRLDSVEADRTILK
jgi:hypothetical protein